MGCPYDAKLVYGIELSKKEANAIQKKLDKLENSLEDYKEWEKQMGDFEAEIHSDEQGNSFYVEIASVTSVSNCSFVGEVPKLEKYQKEINKVYNGSPFLRENFSKSEIKLLLICNYCG